MDWSKVAGFVKRAAPILGTAIGGPAGGLAGGAISLIADAFGVENADDPAEIFNAITADPDAMVKLKQIQADNMVELKKLALQSDQAHLADVQDARARQVAIETSTGKRDLNLYVLAWLVVGGFFISIGVLIFQKLPDDSTGVVYLLFGALIAGFTQVMNYFFGSSKGSSDKTKLLNLKR